MAFFLLIKIKVNNKVALYLAGCHGCEHSHMSERDPYTPYVMGVSAPIPSERKPYMLYVAGMGSPIPFEEAESFFTYHK